jgi:hypothetical protein
MRTELPLFLYSARMKKGSAARHESVDATFATDGNTMLPNASRVL